MYFFISTVSISQVLLVSTSTFPCFNTLYNVGKYFCLNNTSQMHSFFQSLFCAKTENSLKLPWVKLINDSTMRRDRDCVESPPVPYTSVVFINVSSNITVSIFLCEMHFTLTTKLNVLVMILKPEPCMNYMQITCYFGNSHASSESIMLRTCTSSS